MNNSTPNAESDFHDALGAITPGSLLIVHSSFKPLKQEGLTPAAVIHALLERLGEGGTLMMPTFTYCYENFPERTAYDPATTVGVENGILSETFRMMPGVVRSNNPTYSVAACGRFARELTTGSKDNAGLGHGSSYETALKLGAKILLLNVCNNRNSMLHYAEVASGVPYNDIPFRESWGRDALTADGIMKLIPEYPACSEEFSKFNYEFVNAGFAKRLGDSFLIDAQPMVDYVCERIRREPDVMLCHDSDCEPCTLRRERLKSLGLI